MSDIKITMPKLHKGQQEITQGIFDAKSFFNIICCSRQFGKTFMLQWLMLYYALKSKSNLYFISPYYGQVRKSYKEIVVALESTRLMKSCSATELQIYLTNGSVLYFKGSQNDDALRGISPNYLFLDEFAFIKPYAWTKVIRPALNVAGKKCFIASTPRTKLSDFYRMYLLGLEPNKRYKSFRATYTNNPMANMEEIVDARKNLPQVIYQAEYEAEFMDSGGEVFANVDACAVCDNKIDYNEKYYAGIDLGRINDFTVLTIMNSKKEVVFVYRENQTDWQIIVYNIVSHIKRYNVKKAVVETNNIGDVIYELLRKELGSVIDGQWTGSNKSDLIEGLIVEFQNQSVKILKKDVCPEMYNELIIYSYTFNPNSRALLYNAPVGFHDDCVMSLAITLECYKKHCKMSAGKVKFFTIKNNE